jgi:hypothetical protein
VRTVVAAALRKMVIERVAGIHPRPRITLHADADAWSTGSFATVAPSLAEPVDALVAQCFQAGNGADALTELSALRDCRTALGGFVRPTQDWSDISTLHSRMRLLRDAGMDELHLSHLGLVGRRGFDVLTRFSLSSVRAAEIVSSAGAPGQCSQALQGAEPWSCRGQPAVAAGGCTRRTGEPGRDGQAAAAQPHRAAKYFASGWCAMIADVDCSGVSWNSSDSSTPMRPHSSRSCTLLWSSTSGHAG